MKNLLCVQKLKTLSEKSREVIAHLNSEVSTCGFPVYASLDIRDAGWKMGVVDVNLFPAGFNNLSPHDQEQASSRMREFFSAKLLKAGPWRITVVPEAHTNNAGYLQNLLGILKILQGAGCEARLLWPGPPIPKAWTLKTPSGDLVYLPPTEALEGADALLLNHDLSGGIPKVIADVKLPTYPSVNLGWYRRRKSKHFEIVAALLERLQRRFDFIDPWCFSMRSKIVTQVNFDSEEGLEKVAVEAEELFAQLESDYKQREIPESPVLFIKNDAGTYGLGVVSVQSAPEIRNMTKALRKKMRQGKDSVPISQVILQEGIPTGLFYESQGKLVVGETALYLVNGVPIGGFVRSHESLGPLARIESLNAPGSSFDPLPSTKIPGPPFPKLRSLSDEENSNIYLFLSRLHAVAASLEDCPPSKV